MQIVEQHIIDSFIKASKYTHNPVKITRVKSSTADNVPFEMLGKEFIYKLEAEPTYLMAQRAFSFPEYVENVDECLIYHILVACVEWSDRPVGYFVELDVPREAKWNPDWNFNVIIHIELIHEYLAHKNIAFEEDDELETLFDYLEHCRELEHNRLRSQAEERPW